MKAITYVLIVVGLASIVMGITAKFANINVIMLRIQAYFVFANSCMLLALVINLLAPKK